MNDDDVKKHWEANAETWTKLVRAGYDVYRDEINTPAFLSMLGDVAGLRGLDLGCGEGHNTRILARRGAGMSAIDIAPTFVTRAREHEVDAPLGIDYHEAGAADLPFVDRSFDFVTAFMSLMDMPRPERAISEAWRALRPDGFFQFSITHPCFFGTHWEWVRDDAGRRRALACSDYFETLDGEIETWIFGRAPAELRRSFQPFRIPRFHRTLSDWLTMVLQQGFRLEDIAEPRAGAEAIARHPSLTDATIVAYFLILRLRKPAAGE